MFIKIVLSRLIYRIEVVLNLLNRLKAVVRNDLQVARFNNVYIACEGKSKLELAILENPKRYDENNFYVLKKLLKKEEVFIDIGANIGLYSLTGSSLVGSNGRVIAFEPVLHILDKFNRNIALNSGLGNIEIFEFAVSSKNEELEMWVVNLDQLRQGTSTLEKNENLKSMGIDSFVQKPVKAVALDPFLQRHNIKKVNFIKVDVEGHELKVLMGSIATLKKEKPFVLLEHAVTRLNILNIDESKIKEVLENIGYLAFDISKVKKNGLVKRYYFDGKMFNNNLLLCHTDRLLEMQSALKSKV